MTSYEEQVTSFLQMITYKNDVVFLLKWHEFLRRDVNCFSCFKFNQTRKLLHLLRRHIGKLWNKSKTLDWWKFDIVFNAYTSFKTATPI